MQTLDGIRYHSHPSDQAQAGELLHKIGELSESGQIKVQVTNVFPLAKADRAHALSQQGHRRVVFHVAG